MESNDNIKATNELPSLNIGDFPFEEPDEKAVRTRIDNIAAARGKFISFKYAINNMRNTPLDYSLDISELNANCPLHKQFAGLIARWNNGINRGTRFSAGVKTHSSATNSKLCIPVVLVVERDDYEKYSKITQYYQKPIITARRRDGPSALEFWNTHKAEIKEYAAANKTTLDYATWILTKKYNVVFVSYFKPSVAAAVMRALFAPKDIPGLVVVDPCSGWGDRMIGFAAAGVGTYIGVDPNTDLIPGYNAMKKVLESWGSRTKIHMIPAPIQEADIKCAILCEPDSKQRSSVEADLIFTSPPYFDLEIYTDRPKQSIAEVVDSSDVAKYRAWFDSFLVKMFDKCVDVAKPGAFICININNYVDFLKSREDMTAMRNGSSSSYKNQSAKSNSSTNSSSLLSSANLMLPSSLVPHDKQAHINSTIKYGPDYCGDMVREMPKLFPIKYIGVLSFAQDNGRDKQMNSFQPIWIFKKTGPATS